MAQVEVLPVGAVGRNGSAEFRWPRTSTDRTNLRASADWGLPALANASVAARDFFRIAASAYVADTATPKPAVSLHRDLRLIVHVEDSSAWNSAISIMADLLHWLTGDYWIIELETAAGQANQSAVTPVSRVQLLSGGLDSLCGAIIGLRDAIPTSFVGHRDSSKAVSHAQNSIRTAIGNSAEYTTTAFHLSDSTMRRNRGPRSRSLMFMALGIATANANAASELWVPENGFTSINPPLDASRGGTLTTRSTHPYTFKLVRDLLAALSITTRIVNPFENLTKGELVAIAMPELLSSSWLDAVANSFSCAKGGTQFYGGSSYHNCGLCVACVVRRASFLGAGVVDPTIYDCNALSGSDLAGLRRFRALDTESLRRATDDGIDDDLILGSASWPIPTDFDAVLALVHRGVKELSLVPLPVP
jgi:hypothetical protein